MALPHLINDTQENRYWHIHKSTRIKRRQFTNRLATWNLNYPSHAFSHMKQTNETHIEKTTSYICVQSHDIPRRYVLVENGSMLPYMNRITNFSMRMIVRFLKNLDRQRRAVSCPMMIVMTSRKMIPDRCVRRLVCVSCLWRLVCDRCVRRL